MIEGFVVVGREISRTMLRVNQKLAPFYCHFRVEDRRSGMKYIFPLRNGHRGEILTLPHSWKTDKLSIRVIENQNYAVAGFTDIKFYGCGPTFDNAYAPIPKYDYEPYEYDDYSDYSSSIKPYETTTTSWDPGNQNEALQIEVRFEVQTKLLSPSKTYTFTCLRKQVKQITNCF